MNKFTKFYNLFIIVFLSSCATAGYNNAVTSLNEAIVIASKNIEQVLENINVNSGDVDSRVANAEQAMQSGNINLDTVRQQAQEFNKKPKITVLNISTGIPNLSSYIIDELILLLARSNRLEVVTRSELDIIRTEQNFQLSGDVDENTAVRIGKFYEANYVVTGKLFKIGKNYRFQLMALDVEKASIKAPTAITISGNDSQLKYFLSDREQGQGNQKVEERSREKKRKAEERQEKAEEFYDELLGHKLWFDLCYSMTFTSATSSDSHEGLGLGVDTSLNYSPFPYVYFGASAFGHYVFKENNDGFFGGALLNTGFIIPILPPKKEGIAIIVDGFISFGGYPTLGLITDNITPGFSIGFQLLQGGGGWILKYRGYVLSENHFINSINIGFFLSR